MFNKKIWMAVFFSILIFSSFNLSYVDASTHDNNKAEEEEDLYYKAEIKNEVTVYNKDNSVVGKLYPGTSIQIQKEGDLRYFQWGTSQVYIKADTEDIHVEENNHNVNETADEELVNYKTTNDLKFYGSNDFEIPRGEIKKGQPIKVVSTNSGSVQIKIGYELFYVGAKDIEIVNPEMNDDSKEDSPNESKNTTEDGNKSLEELPFYKTEVKAKLKITSMNDEVIATLYPGSSVYTHKDQNGDFYIQWANSYAKILIPDGVELRKAINIDETVSKKGLVDISSESYLSTKSVEFYISKEFKTPVGKISGNQEIKYVSKNNQVLEVKIGHKNFYVNLNESSHNDTEQESGEETETTEESSLEKTNGSDKSSKTTETDNTSTVTVAGTEENTKKSYTFNNDDHYFEVLEDNVTVYDNSTGKLIPVGSLSKGEVYKRTADWGDWHQIKFLGKTGYVWEGATRPAQSTAESNWSNAISAHDAKALEPLTVYDNSSGSLQPFGMISQGTSFQYVKQEGNWIILIYGSRKGYVYAPAVRKPFKSDNQYFEVLEDNVTVYDNSTGKLIPVGSLSKGEVYKRTADWGDWHQIKIIGKTGYVWENATRPAQSGDESNWSDATSTHKATALKQLTVYDNSSGSLQPFGKIDQGTSIQYVKQEGNWITLIYGNRKGYVYAPAVRRPFKSNDQYFEVLEENTTVYDNSTGKLVPVGNLAKGEVYKRTADWGDWHQINILGKTGYIWEDATRPAQSDDESNWSNAASTQKATALEPLTVYDNSSGSLQPFGEINQGTNIQYVKQEGSWITLIYGNRKGYVYAPAVKRPFKPSDQYFEALEENVTVYENSTGKLVPIGKLSKGEVYKRTADWGSWHQIKIWNKTGYVWENATRPALQSNESNWSNAASPYNAMAKENLTVYDNSSGSLKPFGEISQGTSFQYVKQEGNWIILIYGNRTGYVYAPAVNKQINITKTHYETTFENVIDLQMQRSPQVWKDGGFIDASRAQVKYYVNSSNFSESSSAFYQFLDLTKAAGIDSTEINQKVLTNKGELSGKAQAFIDAGRQYNINEIYLISHALHETRNGTSTLSKGVPVDDQGNVVSPEDAVHTVYNMYGYGAVDSDPLNGGAKYAFNNKWFTPKAAIIGGAKDIADNYTNDGQNTLYKMRWNPISPGYPQYATDVSWAVSQTRNISEIYNLIEDYSIVFNVPVYENQPAESGDPYAYKKPPVVDYPNKVYGQTTTDLNFRKSPDGTKITTIKENTKFKVTGTNGTWYKIEYNGQIGWVHGGYDNNKYVNLLNLLEVVATNLNVRETPNGEKVGNVSNQLLAAVLDKDNKIVRDNEWYQVYYNGTKAWVSGGKNGTEYIKVIE